MLTCLTHMLLSRPEKCYPNGSNSQQLINKLEPEGERTAQHGKEIIFTTRDMNKTMYMNTDAGNVDSGIISNYFEKFRHKEKHIILG